LSQENIQSHINRFWPERHKETFTWTLGPIGDVLPDFVVCRVAPQSRQEPWVYVTMGASTVDVGGDYSVEFILLAPDEDALHVETLAMVAHFHATVERKLDLGHIVKIGRPWLGGSACDHLLVSLPYPFGPKLEWFCDTTEQKNTRFLWLLPITASEASYARASGVESLEQRFDQGAIDYVDPERTAVV
jgi:hypothetical protein